MIFYTLLGGFWAASLTDTVQGMIMMFAAIALPVAAISEVGLGNMVASLVPDGVSVWAAATKGLAPVAAIGFVLGLLGIGLGYPGQPHVVNRFMALRDADGVIAGRRIAMGWAVVTSCRPGRLRQASRSPSSTAPQPAGRRRRPSRVGSSRPAGPRPRRSRRPLPDASTTGPADSGPNRNLWARASKCAPTPGVPLSDRGLESVGLDAPRAFKKLYST